MRLIAAAVTDVGRVREGNEDSFVIDERIGLFAVADGMGGHQAGEVASATALESVRALVAAGRPIHDALVAANSAVFEKAGSRPGLRGMGTTVTAITYGPDASIVIGHVGDSRAYLLRGTEFNQLTDDHSLVEELVREGRLTPEQASVHPQRSIITRALGVDAEVDIDVYPLETVVGDRILVCSDGLTTMVQPSVIAGILRRESDPVDAAEQLIETANAAGGEDNITAVVVDVIDQDAPPIDRSAAAVATETSIPTDATAAREKTKRPRRRLFRGFGGGARRALLYLLPALAVIGVAIGVCGWYARSTYYVGFSGQHVTVFRGVPGGLLGWNPTIERRDKLTKSDLTAAERADLADGHRFSNRSDANAFVRRLVSGLEQRTATTTTAPSSTTTSSATTPSTTNNAPTSSTGPPSTATP